MATDTNEMTFLVGDETVLLSAPETPALPMFSRRMMDFFGDLSKALFADSRSREYEDVMSYAYWIRSASLKKALQRHSDTQYRIGRGMAFHIAPSNVPVNFAVSMTSSALAGNISVIRVSNKPFEQTDIICDAINLVIKNGYDDLRKYFCIVRYPHSQETTDRISALCDVRIIWGGDRTISEIRSSPLPPRAIEMTFADRFSLVIINSDEYLQQNGAEVAKGFYTDTYYTDQNACSSPRLVVWMGKRVNEARQAFWRSLSELVKCRYELRPIQAVDKYSAVCMLAMSHVCSAKLVSDDNYITRIELDRLIPDINKYKTGSGLFFEYTANSLDEIVPVLRKECQTISVLGVPREEILTMIMKHGVRGCDRIVSLGQTMGLEFIWDGYKMIESMTRYVYSGE